MTDRFILEINNLSFSYGTHPVLKNIDLALKDREFLALIGPNGGGKTTLVRLLVGLLSPSSGSIRIFDMPPETGKLRIGYVPQTTEHNRDFPVTVLDVVLMGTLRRGLFPSREERNRAWAAMERMGVLDLANHRIGSLSVGQRKRVLIARALAHPFDLLILDEPAASMDAEGQTRLYRELQEINKQATIILVTHDIGFISQYITSVACVNRTLCYHPRPEITAEIMKMAYGEETEILVHGVPRRVVHSHSHSEHD